MCYQVLFSITLFITHWFIVALPEKDWSTQYRNYDKEYHILSKYEDLRLTDLHEFSSPSSRNFTTLYFFNGSLLVGARNSILIMNTTTNIQNVTEINWTPLESQQKKFCILSGTPEDECYNFVKVLAVFGNKLLSCGTNSHYPTCMWREVNTLQMTSGASPFTIQGFVSANPHLKSAYTFSDDGRFFSAATMDFAGNDKRIMNTEFQNFQPYRMLFTKQNNPYWLDDPVFHKSFSIGNYIYFFFDEFGLECVDCDPVRFSRVSRICKGDDGGSNLVNWINFVTFQKARLNCSSGGKYRYHFNNMQDIYWDQQKEIFYGAFSMENSPGQTMSAICSYSLSEIEKVFSGKVKYKESGIWRQIKNPGHIKECTVNPDSIAISLSSVNVRMKTKSMSRSALKDQNKCILVSNVAQTRTEITPFYLDNVRFVKVVVVSIHLPVQNSSNDTEMWYIATDRETILKIGKIPATKEFCIFEEYVLFPNDSINNETEKIKGMVLSPQKDYLVIGSNSKLIRLSLTNCDRYTSESLCVSAQDPLCGWSATENKCIGWEKGKKNDWKQKFTSCQGRLQREAEWSAWSSWFECKNSDGNLCKCRRRSCLYARPSYQCQGEDNELANCTADLSTLTNKTQWWIYGAIHGGWSQWSEWTDCLRGYKNRTRTCSEPAPANGGLPCSDTDMEYVLCEPTRWDDAETSLWTSWTRVRGPERRVTRYKISCTSKSVVMKNLQLRVLRNETMNCTKELCVDPPKVKREQRILTNWSSWLHCNETTEKLRTRHLCVQNSSTPYWTCNEFGVEKMDRSPVPTIASTVEPTTDVASLSTVGTTSGVSSPESTTKPVTSEPSTSELTTKSQTSSALPTTKQSTLPSTRNVECRVTTSGTPSTTTSSDDRISSIATENATTSYNKTTTDSVPLATVTSTDMPNITTKSPTWSQWSLCLCNHDVVLSNRSRGIQHRTLETVKGTQAEYRTCPCKARQAATKPTASQDVNVKFRYRNDVVNGEYSVTKLVIIVSICAVICIIITIVVAVVWHQKRTKSKTLINNGKNGQRNDKYIPVNGFSTTGV